MYARHSARRKFFESRSASALRGDVADTESILRRTLFHALGEGAADRKHDDDQEGRDRQRTRQRLRDGLNMQHGLGHLSHCPLSKGPLRLFDVLDMAIVGHERCDPRHRSLTKSRES